MGHSSLLWSASHGSQLAARRDKTEQSIIHIWTIIRPNLVPRSRGSANGNNVSEVVTVGAESKFRAFFFCPIGAAHGRASERYVGARIRAGIAPADYGRAIELQLALLL
jgi:hypothetical protein